MNTWMWSVRGVPEYEFFSRLMGGPLGQFLIRRFNFFAGRVMKFVTADKSKLNHTIHQHYLKPLAKPAERKGNWVFPKHIIDSSDWLENLWSQREKIRHIPTLFLWGMRDPFYLITLVLFYMHLLEEHLFGFAHRLSTRKKAAGPSLG